MSDEAIYTFDGAASDGIGGLLALSSISITMATNSPMRVEVVGTDRADANSGKVADAAELLARYAKWSAGVQKHLLGTARKDTDANVLLRRIGPGKSDVFNSPMLVSGAGYTVSLGQIQKRLVYNDKLALLSGWNGSIYAHIQVDQLVGRKEGQTSSGQTLTQSLLGDAEGGCAKVMLQLLDSYKVPFAVLVARAAKQSPEAEASLKAIHKANQTFEPILRAFLTANIKRTAMPEGFKGWTPTQVTEFVKCCHNILTSSGNVLQSMAGANGLPFYFGVQYVSCMPSAYTGGFCGKLVSLGAVYDKTPRSYEADVQDIQGVNLGGGHILPIRGVFCQSPLPDSTSSITYNGKSLTSIRPFVYPPAILDDWGPTVAPVDVPSWIRAMLPSVAARQGLGPAPQRTPSVEDVSEKVTAVQKAAQQETTALEKIVQSWLKLHYVFFALDGSTATVSMPLAPEAFPGDVIGFICKGNGVPLFAGYVDSVTHNVSISQGLTGSGGSATTTIRLTHLRAPGFSLPGV